MKKGIFLMILFSCGNSQQPETPEPVATVTPTTTPTTVGSLFNYYQDMLDTTMVHEFGHALGLIHPFDSVAYGHKCRDKLKEVYPTIEFPIRDYMVDRDTKFWDYDTNFTYDKRSIMQYAVCREGYIFDATPTIQDIIEVNILHYVFVESMNLILPVTSDTVDLFRIYSEVPVCTVELPPSDGSYAMHSIKRAISEWNKSEFKLRFDGLCTNNHFQDDHSIRIGFFSIEGEVAGQSFIGRSLKHATMIIGLDDSSKYVVPSINDLIGVGLN